MKQTRRAGTSFFVQGVRHKSQVVNKQNVIIINAPL